MKKKFIVRFFLGLLVLFILLIQFSCKPKKDSTIDENSDLVAYPISIIPDFIETNLTDMSPLYPISEDFIRDFLNVAHDFQGQKLTLKIALPSEWGVLTVERLPEGREMYLLQSKNREWIYLVITSGLGTQRILDILPVAVNLALQNQDILETEVWKTTRNQDGSFSIDKTYNWVRSVGKTTKEEYTQDPNSYTKTTQSTELYLINNMSRFDFIQTDIVPDYSAVVFYYQANKKPENWDEFVPMLQSFCEDYEIIFEEVYQDFDKVMIRDFKLNDITTVDINPYISSSGSGLILLKKDLEPKSVNFGSFERMKIEIKRYFKIIIP